MNCIIIESGFSQVLDEITDRVISQGLNVIERARGGVGK